MLEKLTDIFKNNSVQDIYLVGFVDIEDGAAGFYPDMRLPSRPLNLIKG
ncbi:hypothetical protein ACQKNB_16750 [Lysinibacillus xylanilyticus]